MSRATIKFVGGLSAVLWVASLTPGLGAQIGLNFYGGRASDPINYPAHPVSGAAGANDDIDYSQNNWNNLLGPTGQTSSVVNDSGAAVGGGFSVTWNSANTWTHSLEGIGYPPFPGDDSLMYDFIDDTASPTPVGPGTQGAWIVVSNIPYANYHVVIYGATDTSGINPPGVLGGYAVGLPDGRLLTRPAFGGHPGEFDSGFGWNRIPTDQVDKDVVAGNLFGLEGDHVVFPNLTESDLLIAGVKSGSRGPIPAVQIIEASLADGDLDNLPDEWELIHFGNLSSSGTDDPDLDGLVNTGELAFASNPNLEHSDTDLLTDEEEARLSLSGLISVFLSPALEDTDGNSTSDYEEVFVVTGNDSDVDGLSDLWEVLHFDDLSKKGSGNPSNQSDPDGDDLENIDEQDLRTDPNDVDSDSDGLEDGEEVQTYLTDPLNTDSDGDNLLDGWETTIDLLADPINEYITDPANNDTDGDSWLDHIEIGANTDPTDSNSVPVYVQSQFAVNFASDAEPNPGTSAADFLLDPSDTAGAAGFAQQNWNNAEADGNGEMTEVMDANGALTHPEISASLENVVVEYASAGTWMVDFNAGSGTITNGDTKMLSSYMDDNTVQLGTGPTSISNTGPVIRVSGIPYANYDVVVYFTGDVGNGGLMGPYRVQDENEQVPTFAGNPIWARNVYPKASNSNEYVQATATSQSDAAPGNYAVFPLVREPTLIIAGYGAWNLPHRAVITGIQLISRDPFAYPDKDEDAMFDDWETNNYPGLTIYDIHPGDDSADNDGLDNLGEFQADTDPNDADSDDDTLSDGDEVLTHGSDPNNPDTDGDTMGDEVEVVIGTDPSNADTDYDALLDPDEVYSLPTDPHKADSDDDTFGDEIEIAFGSDPVNSNSTPAVLGGMSFQLRDTEWETGDYPEKLLPGDIAGLIPLTNWNDIHQNWWDTNAIPAAQPLAAVDQDGIATGAEVRWSANGTGYPVDFFDLYSFPDGRVAAGYWDDQDDCTVCGDGGVTNDGIGVSITVSNVPYANYSVILYRESDEGPGGEYGTYTVNGVSKTGGNTTPFIALGGGTKTGWHLDRTALLYGGLTNGTATIRISAGNGPGSPRGSLSAFQILDGVPLVVVAPAEITGFAVNPGAGTYTLVWDSSSGEVYKVEAEGDLVSGPWSGEPGAGSITATNGSTSWSGSTTNDNANYRVIGNPSP